ncbi:NAD/NADP-dependent octopine/nopaline dehydrogenase family protein [Mediterraneibacter massiliensis]|uniref:NAD/NADP-dependent octopine/nopaline dehydrogenase family protein n=1 Tax=Mediterraneibacter massiliensis TaxID=1720300 RepID=UPI00073F4E06|nr:NAD/NADP-dependent octopine/nopaline dehydrogenase family protein [Mediterraneibacter massiliensis]
MIKYITVVGGGSTGHAAAAYLTGKGFAVTLCDNENFKEELEAVETEGGVMLRGRAGRGIYPLACVTHDFKAAVESAELIFVCVPAARHREIAEQIAPYMKEEQSVLILPGNLASFIFKDVFEKNNVPDSVIIAEMEGNLCPCRLTAPAEVTVGLPIRAKKISALPGSKTAKFMERNKGVLDFIANKHVLEGALLSDNYVLHIGTTLLASSTVDAMGEEFILFQHGLTDYAVHCTEAIRRERIRLLAAFGLEERDSATEFFEELRDWKNHPEYSVFRTLKGPDSLHHRYIEEDAVACASMALSCAERLGIEMPVLKSVITLASAVNEKEYYAEGRTLENSGFAPELSMEEIISRIS